VDRLSWPCCDEGQGTCQESETVMRVECTTRLCVTLHTAKGVGVGFLHTKSVLRWGTRQGGGGTRLGFWSKDASKVSDLEARNDQRDADRRPYRL
jgi:hypothetical protein